jgi:hypothetical protein
MAFDKFGKLLGNPESGTRCIFGHNRAPAKMVPGEILIVAHPLTGVAHRQKEKRDFYAFTVTLMRWRVLNRPRRPRHGAWHWHASAVEG